jgi:hypothetical protein
VCIASTISFVIFARHLFAWIFFIIGLVDHLHEKWKGLMRWYFHWLEYLQIWGNVNYNQIIWIS